MRTRRFKQVDVFTAQPFRGNPVAVVLDADGLATDDMQRIARWTNLSETTFVLPPATPGADYRLRIFTPSSELPFAGHPSVGSAHAILEAGLASPREGRLIQECGAGLLPLDVAPGAPPIIHVTAPAPLSEPVSADALADVSRALGAQPAHPPLRVSVGAVWLIVPLADAAAVAGLTPDMQALADVSRRCRATGVTVFGPHASGPDAVAVRSFAPAEGIPEDPVCGSGNAATGWYVATHPAFTTLRAGYSASQGREIGRDGRVRVRFAEGRVQIGGTSITCVDGVLTA